MPDRGRRESEDDRTMVTRARADAPEVSGVAAGGTPSPGLADHALIPGQKVGGYFVKRWIATGGFGSVYEVRELGSGRRRALKLLHQDLSTSTEILERFQREVRAVNLTRHPNVVDISDLGETEDGRPYFVMEFLEGQNLADRLATEGPMSARAALEVLEPLCDALAVAHEQGIVHRDLKASNVFLATEPGQARPRVVLLDFGVAKLAEPGQVQLTTSRHLIGTPAAMAPEQMLGKQVDARADIYAVGILAYQLLSGRRPFEDASLTVMTQLHLYAPRPRVSEVAPVTPRLDSVIIKALEPEASRRYATTTEFRAAFAAALEASSPGAGAAPTRMSSVCLYVETLVDPAFLGDPDDSLLGTLDGVAELLEGIKAKGMRPSMETGTFSLYACPLNAALARSQIERRDTVALATELVAAFERMPGRDPRVNLRVCVHVADVPYDKEGAPMGTMELESWVPATATPGLHVTPSLATP